MDYPKQVKAVHLNALDSKPPNFNMFLTSGAHPTEQYQVGHHRATMVEMRSDHASILQRGKIEIAVEKW